MRNSIQVSLCAVTVLVLILPAGTSCASELTPESRITSVVVYRDGALITREAKLSLPPGESRILLRDIPSVAQPDSVRVSGLGSPGIRIDGVEMAQSFRPASLTPESKALEIELEEATSKLGSLDDRQRAINALRDLLGSIKASAGQEGSKDLLSHGFVVESWQKAFEFLSDRLDALAAEERAMAPRRKELSERIEVLRQKIAQVASQGGIQRWTATALVSAPEAGEMTLKVSYLAQGAAWVPAYDVRLDATSGKVDVIWLTQISQTTGEDWMGVKVALSTTRPLGGIDLPKLASLSLVPAPALAQKAKGGIEKEYVSGLPVLGSDYEDVLTLAPGVTQGGASGYIHGARDTAVVAESPVPSEMAQSDVTRREAAVTFELPGTLDIPSDAQAHKYRVASTALDATTEYLSIPRLNPAVFLVSRVILAGEVPLLPGRVQHFVGSDLVGSSWMVGRVPGEEFPLSFGPDDRLKSERKIIGRRVEQKGKDDETDLKFLTTLENHTGKEVSLTLKDRVPTSGDERISVLFDERETTPGFARDPQEPGILTWTVPVPEGAKREIALHYKVRAPRGLALIGME